MIKSRFAFTSLSLQAFSRSLAMLRNLYWSERNITQCGDHGK
jgi:hypothetical protein